MSFKRRFSIGFSLATCLALGACGGSESDNAASANDSDDTEVAATDQRPPLNCPSQFDIPAPAPGAPQDSVGGLRPGALLNDAILFIQCQDKAVTYNVEDEGGGFQLASSGEPIRQVTRVVNGTARQKDMMDDYHRRRAERMGEAYIDDFNDVTDDFRLVAMGRKGAERVEGIWREQSYKPGAMPPAADVGKALVTKYGPPSRISESSTAANMVWMYDTYGRKMTDGTAEFESCAQSVPAKYGNMSASPSCGLTISARITKSDKNEALTQSLSVGVMNPSKLYAAIDRVNASLKGEDAARKQQELDAASANKADVKL